MKMYPPYFTMLIFGVAIWCCLNTFRFFMYSASRDSLEERSTYYATNSQI